MRKTLVSIITVIIASLTLLAQGDGSVQTRKDSLRSVISSLSEWNDRRPAYQQLSLIYFIEAKDDSTIDSLLAVYDEMEAEAKKNDDTNTQCRIKANILSAYINNNMLDKVIAIAPGYIAFIEKNEEWVILYSIAYKSYASALLRKGDADKSLQVAHDMYEHAKSRNNDDGMAAAYYQIGEIYESTEREKEAKSYFLKAIDLLKNKTKTPEILSTYYFRLCNVMLTLEQFDEALQAASDCEKVVVKLQEQSANPLPSSFWSGVWQLYSNVYLQINEYDKAEAYLDKIDSLGIASLVLKKNNYRKRARIMEYRKDYHKALEYINLSCTTYPNHFDYTAGGSFWIKAGILSQLGRMDEAMDCLREAAAKNDSIRNLDFNSRLDELRVIHEVDTLTAEKELSRRRYAYALAGCALLFIALSVWIYYSRRLRAKNINLARQIIEQNRLYDLAKIRRYKILQSQHSNYKNSGSGVGESEYLNDNEAFRTTDMQDEQTSTDENDLFEQLEFYMDEHQPYTDPSLNYIVLATAMNTNERYLRDCIKNNTGITVNDYITLFRIKHANKLLQQTNPELTIEFIAKQSGFGSRNAFYENYRSAYGLTPTEFRKAARMQTFSISR